MKNELTAAKQIAIATQFKALLAEGKTFEQAWNTLFPISLQEFKGQLWEAFKAQREAKQQ